MLSLDYLKRHIIVILIDKNYYQVLHNIETCPSDRKSQNCTTPYIKVNQFLRPLLLLCDIR